MKEDERVRLSKEQARTSRANGSPDMDSRLQYGRADRTSFVTSKSNNMVVMMEHTTHC